MILLNNISKRFGKKSLFEQLSLPIAAYQITVLLGENGAGKSTLLQILAGLERADSGEILYFEERKTAKDLKGFVGYVPQDIALWEHLSIEDNIQFFRSLIKQPISQQQINDYYEQLHLVDLHQPVSQLSGGTKRKANIIVGLLAAPHFLILDEPTVGIDLKSRYEIHQLLRHLKQSHTIIMTTHHIDELESVADQIAVIGKDPFYSDVLTAKNMSFYK